jgi:hypothetical protein
VPRTRVYETERWVSSQRFYRCLLQIHVRISLLDWVRKFIILDLYQTEPTTVAALAGAALALGIVFWLVRSQDYPGA